MSQTQGIWDFVVRYYPGYDSSDQIANEGDLWKLMNDEHEPGDCADNLLQTEYRGDLRNPLIEIDPDRVLLDIYQRAIQGWIDSQKDKV